MLSGMDLGFLEQSLLNLKRAVLQKEFTRRFKTNITDVTESLRLIMYLSHQHSIFECFNPSGPFFANDLINAARLPFKPTEQ